MLINVTEPHSPLLSKAVMAGGVVVEAFTESREAVSVTDENFDTLVVHSEVPDVFDGVEDLAPGLDSMGVDRIVVLGDTGDKAVSDTAIAGIVLGFDVIIVADTDEHLSDAIDAGVEVRRDVWLRM